MYLKKIVFSGILLTSLSNAYTYCVPLPCDNTISYAMDRSRTKAMNRLGQYISTIKASTQATKLMQKVAILQEGELVRLRERKKIELYKTIEMLHYIKNISNTTSLKD